MLLTQPKKSYGKKNIETDRERQAWTDNETRISKVNNL